ncbi:MAG: hypothetical protein JWQ84_1897 [Mucilaginibacter sp.]|nr:hypothetical protein [Mucilaginibacter sp.]MDB5140856.1 hypothetical protein [Mucilaginibacter sp.]
MKSCLFLLVLVIQCSRTFCQSVLNGGVIDTDDNKPLKYVTIGITSKPNGTVSDNEGKFKLILNNTVNDRDTIMFSSIGYQSVVFLVGELKNKLKGGLLLIPLKKSVNQLKQVLITAKKANVEILGYEKNSTLFGVSFNSNQLGGQAGIIIPIRHPGTNIESISFLIIKNSFKHLTLRVNVYDLIGDKPGNNILSDNIIIQIEDKQTGKMTFDLSKYNVYLNRNCLITLEWIEAQPATGGNCAVAAMVFGHTYVRQASQYPWIKKGTGLGLSVKAVY